MIVTAQLPTIEVEPMAPAAAHQLAAGFLRYASSCWRGDQCGAVFPLRLSAYWRPAMPPAPTEAPAAVSPHGAAGRGIQWHETGQDVLGYVPGLAGGYRVPARAVPSLVRCAPAAA